jgi:hypothetical protein
LKGSSDSADFLEYTCGESLFLINRNQFVFSRMLEGEKPVKTKIPFLDGLLEHQGENLLCLNLEGYLARLFGTEAAGGARIALIVPTALFQENRRVMFGKLASSAKIPLSGENLVCKIGNRALISSVPLGEIKLLPCPVRQHLAGTGFLGVRWKGDSRVQYFIDLEVILFHLILNCVRKNP